MNKEDVKVWKTERNELLNDPINFKKKLKKQISEARKWQLQCMCEACLFADHCDGYDYAPVCMNPAVDNLPSAAEECEAYCNFLTNKGWEAENK